MGEFVKKNDAIYLAGLFDGEGCVTFKYYWTKKKGRKNKTYNLHCALDIAMVDKPTILWCKKATGFGTVTRRIKNKSPSSKPHWKDQWRWNCSHQQAFAVAKAIAPFSILKQERLLEIVNHYVNKKTKY